MTLQVGQKVWHPKTKLVGTIFAIADGLNLEVSSDAFLTAPPGTIIPAGHASVKVDDPLSAEPSTYIWTISSLEPLDEEEYRLVCELIRCKKLKTELNKQVEAAKQAYGAADEAILEYLNRMAIQGTRHYAGVGQVTIDGQELRPSISEENRAAAFAEIREMGRGEIIKETIHSATLESFVNELVDTGVPVPPHISVFKRPKLSFAKKK